VHQTFAGSLPQTKGYRAYNSKAVSSQWRLSSYSDNWDVSGVGYFIAKANPLDYLATVLFATKSPLYLTSNVAAVRGKQVLRLENPVI